MSEEGFKVLWCGAKFHSTDHRIDHARERSNGMFSQ